MAIKKSDPAKETTIIESTSAAGTTEGIHATMAPEPASEAPQKKKSASADVRFCVYLGPTIPGIIQSGTIYQGDRKQAELAIAYAIEKYPLIKKLIVTDKTIAEDCRKVKTAGNALNVYYNKLISGKSI